MLREPYALENIRAQLHQVVRAEIQLKLRLAQPHSLGPYIFLILRNLTCGYTIYKATIFKGLCRKKLTIHLFSERLLAWGQRVKDRAGMEIVWTDAEILAFR